MNKLISDLRQCFYKVNKQYNKIIIICIGTDRCTGDCYGPLVGKMLKERINNCNIEVIGDLENPIHAINLNNTVKKIELDNNLIIAIDACLGDEEDIGKISISNRPINPGKGFGKQLKSLGDVSIKTIVAEHDTPFIDFQNIRLNFIFNLATITSNVITEFFNKEYKEEKAC